MITIIDYGSGNLRSVKKAFEKMNIDVRISDDPVIIKNSDGVVFPGVGAFADAISALTEKKLIPSILDFIHSGKPFLGICLGLQLLFEYGLEYGKTEGFKIFKGKIIKFDSAKLGKLKIPQIGWNKVHFNNSKLFFGIDQDSYFYFVHSYHAVSDDKNEILALTDYGYKFVSAAKKDNVYAVQFHPEKSGENGLKIIKNFGDIVNEYNSCN